MAAWQDTERRDVFHLTSLVFQYIKTDLKRSQSATESRADASLNGFKLCINILEALIQQLTQINQQTFFLCLLLLLLSLSSGSRMEVWMEARDLTVSQYERSNGEWRERERGSNTLCRQRAKEKAKRRH